MNPAPDYTILIVDDQVVNLDMLSNLLRSHEFEVLAARDGETALDIAQRARPDLILLDVILPGTDGFEVCRRLKADKLTEHIPVIFMTVLEKIEDKIQGFQVGAADYITKPFQIEEVLVRVTTQLRLRSLTRELQEANETLERRVAERTAQLAQVNEDLQAEVVERRSAEEALSRANEILTRVNRAYRALSECNRIVVHATEEVELLQEICQTIVEYGDYPRAGIDLVKPDEARTIRPIVQVRCGGNQCEKTPMTGSDLEQRQVLSDSAIHTGKPAIYRDILSDPDLVSMRAEALRDGYASVAVFPLLTAEQETIGALTIYAVQADTFAEEEIRLFMELATDMAFGVSALRTRAERKQMEQDLVTREIEYRTLVEHIPDFVVRYNTDLRRIYVNPAWERASGLSAKEVVNVPPVEVPRTPTPIVAEYMEKLREVLKTGISQSIEFNWVNTHGVTLDLEYVIVPEYDHRDQIAGVLAVGRDITERKQAEAELRKLSRAVEQSPASVIITDTAGKIEYVNPKFTQLTGYALDEVLGQNPRFLKSGHMPPEEYKQLWDKIVSGREWRGEFLNKKKNGDFYWEIASISPVRDAKGTITHFIAVKEDITERKRAEEALRESEQQFRLLAENSTDMISRHAPDGIYLYSSPACKTLLGYEPDELVGHSAYELFHPADAAAVRQSHTTIIEQPAVYTVQYRIRRKEGDYIWFETTSRTIRDSQTGEVIEIQAASRDITKRKQAEEAEQQRRRIAETLVRAAAVLNSTLDLDQVLDLILQQLRRAIDYNSASFLEIEGDHLVISACQGLQKSNEVLGIKFPLDPRLPNYRVVTEKTPLHLTDVGQEYPHFQDQEITDPSHYIHTWLGVPVLSKERVIGVIALDRLEVRPFTNEDIELAGAFANQAAIAIENAQLHKQTQRYAEELEQRVEERTRDLQQEILERKRAEEALRESEARHRIIAELTSDYIYAIIVHPDGTAETGWISGAVERITGYTAEEIRALPGGWDSIAHPDGVADFALLRPRLLSGQTVVHEYQITTKSGEVRWLRDYKKPVWNKEEECVALIWGAVQDITERKQAQAALAEQNNQMQTLLDNIPAFVYFKDVESRFILSNAAHLRSIGKQTVDEVIGKTDLELFPPEMAKQFYADEQELLRTGQPLVNREELSLNEAGEVMWASTTKVPLRDQQGGIVGLVGVTQDITERKQDKEKIEQYATQLEETNRQLLALSRVKDEFVSNVSHELRTPITNLKLRHHLLAARPDRWEGHLAVMSRETQRLEQIIESLLYLSRLDQDRVDWNPTRVDLNQLVSQFVHDRMALAQSGELSLSFTGESDLPFVDADVALWEQALSILLTNAFNYTPAGGHVEVSTQMRERERQRWVGVSVSDTGPGISPDEQSQLFERFFRGTAGRESGTPGTGLGLAIVQEIVNKHRGRVEVSSEGVPGKGATFSLWLLAAGENDEKQRVFG